MFKQIFASIFTFTISFTLILVHTCQAQAPATPATPLTSTAKFVSPSHLETTAQLALSYLAMASDSTSHCDSYTTMLHEADLAKNWKLVLWAAEKARSACGVDTLGLEISMKASLYLDEPHHAYQFWNILYSKDTAGQGAPELNARGENWKKAIGHALAETPYSAYTPHDFRVPPGPWKVGQAAALSTLPGLGQFYLGQWGLGSQYLAVNTAFAALVGWRLLTAVWAFQGGTHSENQIAIASSLDVAILAGLIWPRYWRGSRQEAKREAERRNHEWHRRQYHDWIQ